MEAFRDEIINEQRAAGVRVIGPPHALGFLDSNLPPHSAGGRSHDNRLKPPSASCCWIGDPGRI
jgi:hypothetical protein